MSEGKKKGLSQDAYAPVEGREYEPFVPASENPREVTVRSIIVGCLLGMVFGSANAYLGLVAGLTISTSIPIAVLAVLAFTALPPRGRLGSILETNLSQTIGSASSSLASGMIFTIPALFMWGKPPSFAQLVLVSVSGGLLGILFMIPLRRFLIKGEHGKLPYPEGTACAEVLVAADRGGSESRPIFYGILAGGVLKLLTSMLTLWKSKAILNLPLLPKAQLGIAVSPALVGVGYILGPRISGVMVSGGLLAWLVIIPGLAIWADGQTAPLYPETEFLIRDMEPGAIWDRYVRYIGAGAVAFAGIWSLIRSVPTILESFRVGLAQLGKGAAAAAAAPRTDRDLSLRTVGLGVLGVVVALAGLPFVLGFIDTWSMRILTALLIAVFAFFFVTVSSRIVGLVGVTSNPTSGMTIATLLITSAIFLVLGFTGVEAMAQALLVGAVVATAASIAGDTSQDLKSGFLIGATPRRQQIGEIIGVVTSVAFVAWSVTALHEAYGFGSAKLPAPQASLMKLVVEGVLSSAIPWNLVLLGAGIAAAATIARLPALPFAVGIYLPVATMAAVFAGGLVRWLLERGAADAAERGDRRERGILFGSGLVGGEGLVGVLIAVVAVASRGADGKGWEGFGAAWAGGLQDLVAFAVVLVIAGILARSALRRRA